MYLTTYSWSSQKQEYSQQLTSKSGYLHCVLAPESSQLTTFATPYGRYRWICLHFGLSASSKIFQKHLTHALENLPGVLCIADDILIYGTGETDEEATANHYRSLQDLLQRCKDRGIVLNPDKMKLRMSEVNFMGHLLTNKGLKPDPAPRLWNALPIQMRQSGTALDTFKRSLKTLLFRQAFYRFLIS